MRSFALSPGVDAAPDVISSPPAAEFAMPASVAAMAQVLCEATPSTHHTWTSPGGWGSTPSVSDSPESFGYLVTPPYTPMPQPVSEDVKPSSEQQPQQSVEEASRDSQASAPDISLRGLLQMPTGFGAEALHHPGGILAEFYPAPPASASTSPAPAVTGPLVQRQLSPLCLGVPIIAQTPAPALCLTPPKPHSQVKRSCRELSKLIALLTECLSLQKCMRRFVRAKVGSYEVQEPVIGVILACLCRS